MPGFDDPINDAGRARAQTIEWNCDLAIVSPLRRTTQTLEASRVKYRYKIQSGLCRECLDGGPHNYLPGENLQPETSAEFDTRLVAFRDFLLAQTKARSRPSSSSLTASSWAGSYRAATASATASVAVGSRDGSR